MLILSLLLFVRLAVCCVYGVFVYGGVYFMMLVNYSLVPAGSVAGVILNWGAAGLGSLNNGRC